MAEAPIIAAVDRGLLAAMLALRDFTDGRSQSTMANEKRYAFRNVAPVLKLGPAARAAAAISTAATSRKSRGGAA